MNEADIAAANNLALANAQLLFDMTRERNGNAAGPVLRANPKAAGKRLQQLHFFPNGSWADLEPQCYPHARGNDMVDLVAWWLDSDRPTAARWIFAELRPLIPRPRAAALAELPEAVHPFRTAAAPARSLRRA